ncbi:unnamed protein product [Caenorhabditis angaria]|uniref:Uncharacterized protein n=1 Tax=Caenorhabditis angaria TaxID=860376 RepID=A0A9P1IX41_9PELO|nr:unnamed protein product [Caenorhabditis angaria]
MRNIAQILPILAIFGCANASNLLDPQFKESEPELESETGQETHEKIYWILVGILGIGLIAAIKFSQWAKQPKRVPRRYPIQGPYVNLEMPSL